MRSRSNWNLEVLVFEERGKPDYPEKKLSKQGREPTTNSTHIWRRRRDLNPGHIGGRRVLSPLRHPCPPFNRSYFIQYSTSNIILRIEMSTVNIKIIFVKKQKQTLERSTQGRGANSFITEMAIFSPETDHSCETSYPFDNSRQIGNTS